MDMDSRRRAGQWDLPANVVDGIFDESPLGIILYDAAGFTLQANESAARIAGKPIEALLAQNFHHILSWQESGLAALANRALDSGEAQRAEVQLRKSNGQDAWLLARLEPVLLAEEPHLFCWFLDITERKQVEQKLRKNLEGTIQVIASTIEHRDPYTAGHQHKVADLAAHISTELGMPASQIEGIRYGALIHDLGKIQVPAEILSKPGKLSAPEYALVKTHPQTGYAIVRDVEFPWPVADMIHQHHERLDGSGYPQGLKGEQIIMEARVIAVADVVESMSSHRPYRPSLGIGPAIEEIRGKRGQWYDETVVDACLRLHEQNALGLD